MPQSSSKIIFEFGYLGAILFLLFLVASQFYFANLRLAAHAATLAAICGLLLFIFIVAKLASLHLWLFILYIVFYTRREIKIITEKH